MVSKQSSKALYAFTLFLYSWSSSLYFSASFIILSISSFGSLPFLLVIVSLLVIPADSICDVTVRIPSASISKNSLNFIAPLGAGGIHWHYLSIHLHSLGRFCVALSTINMSKYLRHGVPLATRPLVITTRRSFMWFYTQAWVPNSHSTNFKRTKGTNFNTKGTNSQTNSTNWVQTLILKVQTLKLTVLTI